MKILIIVIICVLLLLSCTRSPNLKLNRSELAYQEQITQQIPTATAHAKDRFESVFKNFHVDATESNIRKLYADDFYFNDTFIILNDIDSLVTHMTKTAGNVEFTTVEIHEVIKTKTDYYLKWTMRMKFTALGKDIDSISIGMSQLRFNEAGKIVFHQDYWDAGVVYEKVFLLGSVIRWIKGQF